MVTIVAFTTGIALGCTDPTAAGRGTLAVTAAPARIYTDNAYWPNIFDPCKDTSLYDCHTGSEAQENYSYDWTGAGTLWDGYDCPLFCTTFPLGDHASTTIRDELNNHIGYNTGCQGVKNMLNGMVTSGRIRLYVPSQDATTCGDYHPGNGDTHLVTENFRSMHQLGITLMHEGFHKYYGNPDNAAAEAYATSCVTN